MNDQGYSFASIAMLVSQIRQLKKELSLAEEGLANYAQENERLRAALKRITECIEYRDGGEGVQVIEGSGREFWRAIRKAKQITHSHESSGQPQSGSTT